MRGAVEEVAWANYASEGAELLESPGGRLFSEGYSRASWEYLEAMRKHLREDSVIDLSLGREPIRRGSQL